VGAIGDALSAGLLVADLGRPRRFLHMLRVFRASSPMSVGTYVLTASGAANTAAALFSEKRGFLGALGRAGGIAGGLLGMPLAGYTGVLIATTAVPVWQESRRTLPLLFMCSGVDAAASLLDLFPSTQRERRVLHRYGIAGKAGALATTVALQLEPSRVPRVARPLRHGASGALLGAATALTAASLILSLHPGRRSRLIGAAAGALGSLALRFAVIRAGKDSARDPQASFAQQRALHGAAEVTRPATPVRAQISPIEAPSLRPPYPA
jgi:formate-dependent nitrite reductase membrane component NrfD